MGSFIRRAAYTATLIGSLFLPSGCISRGTATKETSRYVYYESKSRQELESLIQEGLQHPENQKTLIQLYHEMQRDEVERGGFFAKSSYVRFFQVKNSLESVETILSDARKGLPHACSVLENYIMIASYVRSKNQGFFVPLVHLYPYLYCASSGIIDDVAWDQFRVMFNAEVKLWMYCKDDADFRKKLDEANAPVIAHVHYHLNRCTECRDGRAQPNQASRTDEEHGLERPELVIVPHNDQLEAWLTWKGVETFVGSIPLYKSSEITRPGLLENK